jgi:hypothetical protein
MVRSECTIELDANGCSVPWRLIGKRVSVVASGGRVRISHDGVEVAVHAELAAAGSGCSIRRISMVLLA